MKKLISLLLSVIMVLAVIPALATTSNATAELVPSVTWTRGDGSSTGVGNLSDDNVCTRLDFDNWSAASGKSAAVYWKLKDGVLTVVGSGDLTSDSSTAYAGFPWYTRGAEIETVILIGFTTIGTGAVSRSCRAFAGSSNTSYAAVGMP